MKKVKPLKLEFTTAKEQAEYFFNREFQSIRSELVKNPEGGYWNIVRPSEVIIIEDFFDNIGDLQQFIDEFKELESVEDLTTENWRECEEFLSYVENSCEYEDYKYGDFEANNYPMWGWVFGCDSFWTDSKYMNVDKLHRLGFGVCEDVEGNQYLFICGAGYDFYDEHWIPLFKEIGWIKEVEE